MSRNLLARNLLASHPTRFPPCVPNRPSNTLWPRLPAPACPAHPAPRNAYRPQRHPHPPSPSASRLVQSPRLFCPAVGQHPPRPQALRAPSSQPLRRKSLRNHRSTPLSHGRHPGLVFRVPRPPPPFQYPRLRLRPLHPNHMAYHHRGRLRLRPEAHTRIWVCNYNLPGNITGRHPY